MTGYNTRSKYMRRKVNLSSFSSYPSLLQILSSTEDMFHEVERDIRMAPTVSSTKFHMKSQGTMHSGSAHTPAPVVHLSVEADSSSTPVASSLPSKFPSSHHTPSKSPAIAASFPASVLWTPDDIIRTQTTSSSNELQQFSLSAAKDQRANVLEKSLLSSASVRSNKLI